MCPPNHLIVLRSLDHNIKALLQKGIARPDGFGIGMAPVSIINGAVRQNLVVRDGFFRSGQPRWRLTMCGLRVGSYSVSRDSLYDTTAVDMEYDAGECPRISRPTSYHAHEQFDPVELDLQDGEEENDEQEDHD